MKLKYPIPSNEEERVWALSEFEIDYTEVSEKFKDLTKLAAKIAGTEISLINLIDSYTQWTIANYGLPGEQLPREDSVCQYTIMAPDEFEVKELSKDERFHTRDYVVNPPYVNYYFGIPLKTPNGYNLGALCVLDKVTKELSPEKIEVLKIIASEVVNRLISFKTIQELKQDVSVMKDNQKKMAHDIRGPIGGIISLTQIIKDKGDKNQLNDVLDFINMINRASSSILDMATDILNAEDRRMQLESTKSENAFKINAFKEKLLRLYAPQATNKEIDFSVNIHSDNVITHYLPKSKLLQIAGNLISNAMKFTPKEGAVTVDLCVSVNDDEHVLKLVVSDTGIGLTQGEIDKVLTGNKSSTEGTEGEGGYGFGLSLVKRLVDELKGTLNIESTKEIGTKFIIEVKF